jgi:hypothetical protein
MEKGLHIIRMLVSTQRLAGVTTAAIAEHFELNTLVTCSKIIIARY